MHRHKVILSRLRTEEIKQYSGACNLHLIPKLKNQQYYVEQVELDGDQPKQYLRAYFYYKNCPWKSKPESWPGFYAKFGYKSYPLESITEYAINQIGESLGLLMNETRLVMVNGQVRFLSEDFIKLGTEKLIHGVEILHEYF